MFPALVLAAAGGEAATEAGKVAAPVSESTAWLFMLGFWALIVYFMLIRPGKRQKERRQAMLDAIKKNDQVLTSSGILGVVSSIKENEIVLRVDDSTGTKIRFTRDAIVNVLKEGKSKGDSPEKAKEPRDEKAVAG